MVAWFFGKKKASSHSHTKNDDFVSLSSHELRSPLSIIKWYTEMLLDGDAGPLTEDQHKYLTVIESSNERAIALVRSLLNVSRLDLGTFSVSPALTSISSLVTEALGLLEKEIALRRVTITREENGELEDINVDKHLCIIAIKNVLSNAVLFSKPEGHIVVTTGLSRKGEHIGGRTLSKDSIVVTIADNGIGIPPKDVPHIFSKMFKAGNVKDSDGTGSGLGLYITKSILDYTGGDIWFVSKEQEGSTFYVSFPIKGMKKKDGRTTLD